jgi:hypothetical protein
MPDCQTSMILELSVSGKIFLCVARSITNFDYKKSNSPFQILL